MIRKTNKSLNYVWLVEFHWNEGWEHIAKDDGVFVTYITKKSANADLISDAYSGHPSDLRIQKYVRR